MMCFSKGAIGCCCVKCTYSMRDWIGEYTPELVESFLCDRTSFTDTVLESDGSPIKCDGKIGVKREPCLEISLTLEPQDFPGISPFADSYVGIALTSLWFGTWTPDGKYHSATGRVDISSRKIYLRSLNGNLVRDWDYDRDGLPVDPNITTNAFQAGIVIVRQSGRIFTTGLGTDEGVKICEPGFDNKPPAWARACGAQGKPYLRPRVWSLGEGTPGSTPVNTWGRIRLDDDPLKPYDHTEAGVNPDNSIGAPDWEIGIGIGIGFSNSPAGGAPAGQASWEPFINTGRIDNYCLIIDPPE